MVLKQLTIHNINFMFIKYRSINQSAQPSRASWDTDSEQNGQQNPKKSLRKKKWAQAGWGLKSGATRQANMRAAHVSLHAANFSLNIWASREGFQQRIASEIRGCAGGAPPGHREHHEALSAGENITSEGKRAKRDDMKSIMNICKSQGYTVGKDHFCLIKRKASKEVCTEGITPSSPSPLAGANKLC